MIARWHLIGCCAVCLVFSAQRAPGQNAAPTDAEIAAAITRSVQLSEAAPSRRRTLGRAVARRAPAGHDRARRAGIAGKRFGPGRAEIARARALVERLARVQPDLRSHARDPVFRRTASKAGAASLTG